MNTLRCLTSTLLSQFSTRSLLPIKTTSNRSKLIRTLFTPTLLSMIFFHFPRVITDILYNNEYSETKTLSALADNFHDVIVHTLNLTRGNSDYRCTLLSLLSSPAPLLTQYKLDIQYFFAVVRSVLDVRYLLQAPDAAAPSSEWDLLAPANETAIKQCYPPALWDSISYHGFLIFWLLHFRDLSNVDECYAEYLTAIKQEITQKQASHAERSLTRQINELKREMKAVEEEQQQGAAHVKELDSLLLSIYP